MLGLELLIRHSVFARLPFFSYKGKVKDYLGDTVGNGHEKSLVPEYALMFKMRLERADILNGPSRLVEVGVIDYKAGVFAIMLVLQSDLVPKLTGDTQQRVTSFYGRILYETVVNVLPCLRWLIKREPRERDIFFDPIKDITIKD